MTTVYLVSEGHYSNYKPLGIYSTKENAEKAAAVLRDHQAYPEINPIAEFELDAEIDRLRQGLRYYEIYMQRDGTVISVETANWADPGPPMPWIYNRRRIDGRYYEQDWFAVDAWATDPQHAVKIANECRASLIASGAWDRLKESGTDTEAASGE